MNYQTQKLNLFLYKNNGRMVSWSDMIAAISCNQSLAIELI